MVRAFPLIFMLAIMALATGCIRITEVVQPTSAQAGDVITVRVGGVVEDHAGGSARPNLSVRLPNDWTLLTPVTFNGDYNGTMTLDAALTARMQLEAFAGGTQWTAVSSSVSLAIPTSNTLSSTATLKIKVGPRAGIFQLNYWAGTDYRGLALPSAPGRSAEMPITVHAARGAGWTPPTPTLPLVQSGNAFQLTSRLVNLGSSSDRYLPRGPLGMTAKVGATLTTRTSVLAAGQGTTLTLAFQPPQYPLPGRYWINPWADTVSTPALRADLWASYGVLGPRRGFVFSPNANQIHLIDPDARLDVATSITLNPAQWGSKPSFGALSRDRMTLFTSMVDSKRVVVINTATRQPVKSISVGAHPGPIVLTRSGTRALVANQSEPKITVLNTVTRDVQSTLTLPAPPLMLALNSRTAYASMQTSNSVAIINLATMTVSPQRLTGLMNPTSMAISPDELRLFVATGTSIAVFDTRTNDQINTFTLTPTASIVSLSISDDGRLLLVGDNAMALVHVLNADTGAKLRTAWPYSYKGPISSTIWIEPLPTAHAGTTTHHYALVLLSNVLYFLDVDTGYFIESFGKPNDLAASACDSMGLFTPAREWRGY